MSDDCALAGGLCIDFHRHLSVVAVESFIVSFGSEAGQRGQALRASKRLKIAIENIVGGGRRGSAGAEFNFVGMVHRRLAVLFEQTRDHLRSRAAPMAGVATDSLAASKEVLVDRIDHLD